MKIPRSVPRRFRLPPFAFLPSVLLAFALSAGSAAAAEAPIRNTEHSVVKVFSTIRYPDLSKPWTKEPPSDASGSGVVIEGHRILTNAHVVLYATQIQVQADLAGDKISATVESIAPGIDLAVLKLDDDSFFDTHPPLPRASTLPGLKDSVLVYGFPTGGDSLSITKGVVSRIEFVPYNYPVSGLRIQIDAAINPGNSGGPAVVGDKMIGLAFSRLGNAENIGYIIPCEEIEFFLKAVAGGHPYAKPGMFDQLQTLENPALRSFLKADASVKGMVVYHPDRDDAAYPLKKWDIITQIGGTAVDDEGMIKVNDDLRVHLQYLVQKDARDGKVPLTVVRAGKAQTIQLPVSTAHPMLMEGLENTYPPYFIFGPVVFSVATSDFVNAINSRGSLTALLAFIGNPMIVRRGDQPAFPGEQLVVISSPFLPHQLAKGYPNPTARVISKVNGIKIKNLHHLVLVLRDSKDANIVIESAGIGGEILVFPRQAAIAATDDILADNGIRSQGSPKEMEIWNAKTTK